MQQEKKRNSEKNLFALFIYNKKAKKNNTHFSLLILYICLAQIKIYKQVHIIKKINNSASSSSTWKRRFPSFCPPCPRCLYAKSAAPRRTV